jgi:hypothetical protein
VRVKNQDIFTSYLSPSPSSPPARGGEMLLFTRSSLLNSAFKNLVNYAIFYPNGVVEHFF